MKIFKYASLLSLLFILPQPVWADGRRQDIVVYKGIWYDGQCLHRLAKQHPGISDAEYEPLMADCVWNGEENPSVRVPVGTTINCDDSTGCVTKWIATRLW